MKQARRKSKKSDESLERRRTQERPPNEPSPQVSLLHLQRRAGNRAVVGLFESQGQLQRKAKTNGSAADTHIQRAARNGDSAGSATDTAAETAPEPVTSTAGPLIVDDDAETVAPGQMRKSEFLAQLRTTVCSTADETLAEVGESTAGCPYIEKWLGYYEDQPPSHIERALRKFAPEAATATNARDYIPMVSSRVRQGIHRWSKTGELPEVPDELKNMMGAGAAFGAMGGLLGGIGSAIGGAVSAAAGAIGGAFSSIGKALFKRREGHSEAETGEAQEIQGQLSEGHPLPAGTGARMGSAFGHDFSEVRVHTGADAAGLSDELNARAFTVGSDIAFGAGEYQPGTLIGDALIAHELAHVVQQGGGHGSTSPQSKSDDGDVGLEDEADVAAVGAVSSLWLGEPGAIGDLGRKALPRMRSGLRLQKCSSCSPKHTITNQGRVVTTRESGHEREVQDPRTGLIRVENAPDMTDAEVDRLLTDLRLISRVKKLRPPTNDYDCHGWTFLGGQAWIDNDQVPAILADNGYVTTTTPAVGDILIYNFHGELKHSGIVTEVKGGTVTKISSKWGLWGLYEHDPNDVPPNYGVWTVYHTNRPAGHQLQKQK